MNTIIEHMTEVLKAFSKGKNIQCRGKQTKEEWRDVINPVWNFERCEYRVKPEPQYRPYDNAQEFITALEKHGKYLVDDDLGGYYTPLYIDDSNVALYNYSNGTQEYTYQDLFDEWSHQDGTVCGILTMEAHE